MVRVQISPRVRPIVGFSRFELRGVVQAVVHSFGWTLGDIEILVTSDLEIAQINREFLELPGPTNVLSFPLDQDPEAGLNGSLVLSAHALNREADLYAQPLPEHCLRLLVHALLHLAGLEHGPMMEAMTDQGLHAARRELHASGAAASFPEQDAHGWE